MNEVMMRLQNIFALPLCNRCEEIRRLVAESSQKELSSIFPIVLENIFGINNQPGWNLCTLNATTNPPDYEYVFHFLHSQGPMFNLIYRLMSDCYLKYEFPLSLFPPNVKRLFEENIPQYYLDKIQVDPQMKVVTSLALNPFEYYIFHFASYLVSPCVNTNVPQTTDSVYTALCEDYLLCFLPCTRSEVLPIVDHHVVKTPVPRPQVVTTPVKTPTIFRASILSKANPPTSFHSSPNAQTVPHMEVWRTETVIQAFLDLWLTYGCNEASSYGRVRAGVGVAGTNPILQGATYRQWWGVICGLCAMLMRWRWWPVRGGSYCRAKHNTRPSSTQDLPSTDRIRIVRLLVKHFHFFANMADKDMSSMGEIRRSVRQVTRRKIYLFLRRAIQDWPLDSSFRGVLETWLSFIQPWRYINFEKRSRNQALNIKDAEENYYGVDRHLWSSFIVENLFAYTIIFQQLIPRFSRLDLTTPRNAHMLHRVSKVFAQPNLNSLLAEIEACLSEEVRQAALRPKTFNPGLSFSDTMPDLINVSPIVTTYGHKWNAELRQLLQELEGPHYEYNFLFDYSSGKMEDLLKMVHEATIAAHVLVKCEEQMKKSQTRSFLSKIREFFSAVQDSNEFSLDERKKVVIYLETSLKNFAIMFKMTPPTLPDLSNMTIQDVSSFVRPEYSSLYQFTNNNVLGSDHKSPRSPHMLRFRKAAITYEGDPDLQPVRSDEVALLVRIFYMISSFLNTKYRDEMATLFYRTDFVGKVVRQVLCAPLVIRTYDKSGKFQYSPLVESVLPPRISLRRFAGHQFLSYLIITFLNFWYWNFHPMLLILWFSLGVFMFIVLKAVLEPLFSAQESRSPGQSMNAADISDRDLSCSF